MTEVSDRPPIDPSGDDPYRLPRSCTPRRYDVVLEPDLDAATFMGRVDIAFDADADVDRIVLNAIDLEIAECRVDDDAAPCRLDDETERLIVETGVGAGAHTLSIRFTGVLNDQLRGWYRSTYRDESTGDEHVIATTQMQATDCRRAFPCWDEPDFKAVFAITLIVSPELLAVSNGRELSRRERDDDLVEIRFADTMPMSSYLVAFVVGPLEATDWVDVDGVPARIVHVPGKGHLTEFGLDVTAFCLRWYQEYYGIPYPTDKVELIALPDFAAGAMENLGCITFRENLLLVDPATSTQNERQLVADVVAHELAHMWFGDLVTMRWWNGIWLNEAFATFMEIASCDAYRPDWQRWTHFGLERSVAFETDSLSTTRPVEYEVRSPADCEGMFDVLTYQKGGALLRMLEQYLGEDRFRAGVSHYLETHAHGNTETGDLWDAIEHTSGEPVRRIMDSWIWQPGFPVVSASTAGDQLVLRQQRFAFDTDGVADARWAIPLAVRQGDDTESVLLDGDELSLPLADGPVIVNAGGHGFVRVSYDAELRARLTGDVVAGLTTLERYNLIDDAWNAVVAGAMTAADFLDLTDGFTGERELAVWQSIAVSLRAIRRLLDDDSPPMDEFAARVRALASPAAEALGDPSADDSDLTAKLRGLLLAMLALQGNDDAARTRASRYYDDWATDPASVDPELAAAATGVLAATGGPDVYDRMFDQFKNGATPQVQLRHLYALAEFDSAALVERTCELAMTNEVKTQNAPFLIRGCLANRHHGAQAWAFLRQRWAEANDRFPRNTIVRMVDAVTTLDRPDQVADVHAFFAEHPIPQGAQTLEQALERQRVNAALRDREAARLSNALSGQSDSESSKV